MSSFNKDSAGMAPKSGAKISAFKHPPPVARANYESSNKFPIINTNKNNANNNLPGRINNNNMDLQIRTNANNNTNNNNMDWPVRSNNNSNNNMDWPVRNNNNYNKEEYGGSCTVDARTAKKEKGGGGGGSSRGSLQLPLPLGFEVRLQVGEKYNILFFNAILLNYPHQCSKEPKTITIYYII
jgi:hypothetical protein